MKMIKKLSFLLLLAASVLSLQSCKKENGLQSFSSTVSFWSCGSFNCDATIAIPELTSDILDNGLVMVYMNAPAGSGVTGNVPLPLILSTTVYEVALIEVGKITLRYFDSASSNPSQPSSNSFKVVLVENWKSANLQNIDKNDFKAVSKIASKIIDVNIEK
jgi:hypothetical protein